MTCIKRCPGPHLHSSLGKAVALSVSFAVVSACPFTTEADSHAWRTFVLRDHGISISVPSYWRVGEPYEVVLLYEKGITSQRIDLINPSNDAFPIKGGCTLYHSNLHPVGRISLYGAEGLAPLIAGRITEPEMKGLITIKREGIQGSAYYERIKRATPDLWSEAWIFFDHFDVSGTTLHALTCNYKEKSVSLLHENVFNSIVFLRPSSP